MPRAVMLLPSRKGAHPPWQRPRLIARRTALRNCIEKRAVEPQLRTKVQEHPPDLGLNTYSRGPIRPPARNVLARLPFVGRVQQRSLHAPMRAGVTDQTVPQTVGGPCSFRRQKAQSRSRAAWAAVNVAEGSERWRTLMKATLLTSAMALIFVAMPIVASAAEADVVIKTHRHHHRHVAVINDQGQRLHHRRHGTVAFYDQGRRHHHRHDTVVVTGSIEHRHHRHHPVVIDNSDY